METLLILAAVAIANWALHRWVLKPDQQRAKVASIGDVSLPRATEDAPVPLIYGRCRINGGNVVWYGKLATTDILDGDGNAVGYNYYLPFQMVLGIPGGVDPGAKLGYVWLDDVIVGFGTPWMATTSQAFISPASGPQGLADWYGGDPFIGYTSPGGVFETLVLPDSGEDPTLFPQYKGYCLLTFYQAVAGQLGFWLGDNVSPGALAFEVQADCAGLVDPSLGAIGKGDANPVNVLYDILTNKFARLGISPSLIDLPSFLAAGQTFVAEQQGFSLAIYNSNDARSIIREILAETASVLFQDWETQKIKIKLIRFDYNPLTVPTYDPSTILQVSSFAMSTWSSTYNEVRIIYTDRDKQYTDRTAFATDLANYAAQNSTPRVLEFRYPGISNVTTAAFVAGRELRALSRPLRRARLVIDRTGFTLRPGDVFRFVWPDYGLAGGVVMRVTKVDLGEFAQNGVTVDAVEDVFSLDATYLSVPRPPPFQRISRAYPLLEHRFDEAPRWLQTQGVNSGRFANVDLQHAWYLGVPGTNDATMQGKLSTDDVNFFNDGGRTSFAGRAKVHTTYARTNDPYDTSVGIVIDSASFTPATLAAGIYTVAQQISVFGANMLLIGGTEIIAYEQATNLGGGQWLLSKIWRGELDTVPVDHVAGERVYQLTTTSGFGFFTNFDVNQIGITPIAVNQLVYGRERPFDSSGAGLVPETDLPVDSLTIRARTLLPYPGADLQLASSKTPAALQEEGVDVTWRPRDRLNTTIQRGDALSEVPEAGTSYSLRAAKLGLAPAAAVDLQTGIAPGPPSGVTTLTRARLSKAGHGTLSAQIRSTNANGIGWQDAALSILALFWRNLLSDPRFAFNDGSWIVTSGTGTVTSTGGLGNGPYFTGFTGTAGVHCIFNQTCDVTGYKPVRLRAHLAWYDKNTSAGDTAKATITALDSGGGSLGTATVTNTPSTTAWTRRDLFFANLPTGTVKLKVEFETAPAASGVPTSRISEVCLRLGQSTGTQLIANNDFETGTTSWTVAAGTFTTPGTAPLYTGAAYLADATLSTTNTLRQDVTLPAGYEYGTAVCEFARGQPANTGPGKNTGEVKLQALDGGGSVLATSTTGAEIFTADTWTRRRLTLEIPASTAKLRVEFDAVAGGATNLKAALDDVTLFAWKHLDPDAAYTARFDAAPVQVLPSERIAWEVAFPSCPAPDYLIYDGSSVKASNGEGDMTADTDVFVDAAFVGAVDTAGLVETSCYDFSASYVLDAGLRDVHAASDPKIGAFTASDRWAVVIVFKAGNTPSSGTFGLCGRVQSFGWALRIVGGVGRAAIEGVNFGVHVDGTTVVTDGGLHYLGIAYDGTNLHLYDEAGDHTIATAGAGDFAEPDASVLFRIGRSTTGESTIAGQIARVYAWSDPAAAGVAAPTRAQVASTWTYGADPSAQITTYTRAGGTLVVPAKDGNAGARAVRWGTAQTALAYQAALAAGGGTGYGLALARPCTNLCTDQDQAAGAAWASGGSLVKVDHLPDVEGTYLASVIQGDNTSFRELAGIAIGAVAATAYVIFYARSYDNTAFSMRSRICDSTGATVDTFDVPLTADGKWIRVAHPFAWSGATATMRLRFFPSNSGTSHLAGIAGPYFVGKDGFMPMAYGFSGAAVSAYPTIAAGFSAQVNAEGELIVVSVAPEATPAQGTLAELRNGTNANDKRRLYIGATSSTRLDHFDGSAASNTAATSGGGIISDRTTVHTERGRWNQAEVFDAATVFSNVEADALAIANGRVVTWTRSTVAMADLDVGHDNGSDVFAGAIRSVQVYTRETKL